MRRLLREGTIVLCVLFLLTLRVTPGTASSGWEIDVTASITRVIDGDTLHGVPVGRVRLADIDAPEVGQPGAREATEYLMWLVHRKQVFLDVDDVYGTDRYGRVVAVVYVRHNETHLSNVNEALLCAGHAALRDFPNEFDPASWSLHVFYPGEEVSMFGSSALERAIGMAALVAAISAAYLLSPLFRRQKPS